MVQLILFKWLCFFSVFVKFNVFALMLLYEPRCEKTCLRVSDQVRHKPVCTATEDGQRLEISDVGSKGLYYPYSKNKGADQLRGNREADLRLCFRICKKAGFLTTRLI